MINVGDTVYYKNDWKGKRPWFVYKISDYGLYTIVLLNEGKIINIKNGKERLNSSIVNVKECDLK